MSTVIDNVPAPPRSRTAVVSEPVSLSRATRSEWVKFRSLRSSWAVLGSAMLGMLVIGLVVAYNTRHVTANLEANDLAPSATLQGYYLAQLLIGSLGVLFVSSEFSTGMIRSTFAAVPKRLPVLWAKIAVILGISAASMTVITVVSFLASQDLIGHYRVGFSLSDPGVWRVVLGTSLYLSLVAVLGGMLGWIVRSTPGALVSYLALLLLLPVLGGLFGSAGRHAAQFFPSEAGAAFSVTQPDSPHLSPGVGLIVLCGWVAVGIVVAMVSLRRRDA